MTNNSSDSSKAETDKNPIDYQKISQIWQDNLAKIIQNSTETSALMMAGAMKELAEPEKNINQFEQWAKLWGAFTKQPEIILQAQQTWLQGVQEFISRDWSAPITNKSADKRFKDELWNQPAYATLRDSYLKYCEIILNSVENVQYESDGEKERAIFNTKQFLDTIAPTNFLITNPTALKEFQETNGQSFIKGLENYNNDLKRGGGKLRITQTDESVFEVGKNIATSKGVVVFKNKMMELIQYTPSTAKVGAIPLIITPPWINKFYILDLQPQNSFIKWAVDSGLTVFIISWINPDETYRDVSFDDYVELGVLAAITKVNEICGTKQCNMIGYCIGGTLLAITLSYMAKHKDKRVKSATFFTTLLDFNQPGDLKNFIDDEQITLMENKMMEKGYLDGADMAMTFSALRANDLIWSFYVNNYLLGKSPKAFDLLYWNGDSTRMPCKMHSFYLRNMYLHNRLIEKNAIEILGTKIDLKNVKIPTYFISAREDHIAPWGATYRATHIFGGKVKFVLSASGHIAGIVNHPDAKKYNYWVNDNNPSDANQWFQDATSHDGSWWGNWREWLEEYNEGSADALKPKDVGLGNAPGSFVLIK